VTVKLSGSWIVCHDAKFLIEEVAGIEERHDGTTVIFRGAGPALFTRGRYEHIAQLLEQAAGEGGVGFLDIRIGTAVKQ
jgi:hypothetical protein